MVIRQLQIATVLAGGLFSYLFLTGHLYPEIVEMMRCQFTNALLVLYNMGVVCLPYYFDKVYIALTIMILEYSII